MSYTPQTADHIPTYSTARIERDIIGEGTDDEPRRPDFDGPYRHAEYDMDAGTVTFQPIPSPEAFGNE